MPWNRAPMKRIADKRVVRGHGVAPLTPVAVAVPDIPQVHRFRSLLALNRRRM